MRIIQCACLISVFYAIGFLTMACGHGGHKGFYEINYPQVNFTLSLPNELVVEEAYFGKNDEGDVYRRIDSTGTTHLTPVPKGPQKDTNAINERQIVRDPGFFFCTIGRGGWNLTFTGVISGKYMDTAIAHDINKIRQKDFLEMYVFGPGRDSSFYADITATEITKDGRKLFKITDPEGYNITYTGMVNRYWFMLQFMVYGEDTAWGRKIWDQSSFTD